LIRFNTIFCSFGSGLLFWATLYVCILYADDMCYCLEVAVNGRKWPIFVAVMESDLTFALIHLNSSGCIWWTCLI